MENINNEELVYYKTNVMYSVGVRYHMGDKDGKVLTGLDPYVAIPKSKERDFRRANRNQIEKGLIIPTQEPSVDWDTPNQIDDDKAASLVKNILALKKALREIDEPAIVSKLLDEAKAQDRPHKTVELIEKRLSEMQENLESPLQMRGVE